MSSSTGDIGINGNLNVSNTLNSSGLSVNSGTVNFTGAAFTNSCIPSAAISGSVGGNTNASTITVSSDASTISNGFLTYCGVTNNNVVLRTFGSLRFNSTTGTLSAINFIGGTTTQPTSDNSTNLASTEFVQNNISSLSSIYASIASLSSYLTTTNASSTYATKTSPALTGTPTSPTPATSDNSTNIATTAYVQSNLSNFVPLIVKGSYYLTGCNPTPFSVTGSSVINQTMSTPLYPYNTYYVTGTFTNTLNIILPIPSSSFAGFLFILKRVSGTSGTSLIFKTATGNYMVGPAATPPAVSNSYNTSGGQSVNTTFQAVCLLSQTTNTYYWYCLTP